MRVLERQKSPFAAAASQSVDIGALPAVALPHLASDFDRHVAWTLFQRPPLALSARAPSPPELAVDQ